MLRAMTMAKWFERLFLYARSQVRFHSSQQDFFKSGVVNVSGASKL